MKRKCSIIVAITTIAIAIISTGCGNGSQVVQGEPLSVGDTAPDFSVELLNGETVQLSNFRGSVVLLNFWATWCGPCVGKLPDIEKLSEAFADELIVLAINRGERRTRVDAFIEQNGYTFKVGLDESNEISALYPSAGIPYTVVIDADGVITSVRLGAPSDVFAAYEEVVNAALGISDIE